MNSINTFGKKTILLFVLPCLVFLVLLECFLRHIPNEFSFKKKYLDKHASQIELLILGNSIGHFGIDPSHFSANSFNAAHIAKPLQYDFKTFDRYAGRLARLKIVVLPISFVGLNKKIKNDAIFSPWGMHNYVIYYDMPNTFSYRSYFEVLSMPVPNIKKKIGLYCDKKIQHDDNYGWSPLGWGNFYQPGKGRDMEKDGLKAKGAFNPQTFKQNVDSLTQFTHKLKAKGIKLYLVTPPILAAYRKHINRESLSQSISTFQHLAKDNANCFYLDLSDYGSFQLEDFYDSNHLNALGAKKLSLLLNDTIKTQSLQKNKLTK